jgi:K+/H+ antiporter YhaU regulatory subunit KhtT
MPGVVRDANGQALAYVYSRSNEAEAMQAKVLTEDEARRIAANIAKTASAVAARRMICRLQPRAVAPWVAESGLTKGLAVGRFRLCNWTVRPAAVASAMGQYRSPALFDEH